MPTLAEVAQRADAAVERARRELVTAVRAAHAAGQTQAEIAREIGRSQPEVSRLLRFNGTSPRAMALRKHRVEVVSLIKEAGGSNIRVFGSVATGRDHEASDIDLLVDLPLGLGLLKVSRLERLVSEVVGTPVDIVPSDDIRPYFKERVLGEAVTL